MNERRRWIEAGAVLRPHGIEGEVAVEAKSDLTGLFAAGARIRVTTRAGAESFREIISCRPHHDRLLVRFAGIESRNDAEDLRSSILWMDREAIGEPEQGRWFVQDILGIDVFTEDGEHLGTVTDVMSTAANDVYVVSGSRSEVLLPATDGVIRKVDLDARRMTVRLIEGLR